MGRNRSKKGLENAPALRSRGHRHELLGPVDVAQLRRVVHLLQHLAMAAEPHRGSLGAKATKDERRRPATMAVGSTAVPRERGPREAGRRDAQGHGHPKSETKT